MNGSLILVVIFTGVLSILSISFVGVMVHQSASTTYQRLHIVNLTLDPVDAAAILTATSDLQTQIANVSYTCSEESTYYYNTRAAVNSHSAVALNQSMYDVVGNCTANIATLEAKIALVSMSLTPNLGSVIQSGTIASVGTTYELRRLVFGTQLNMVYLVLPAWSGSLATSPNVVFSGFSPVLFNNGVCNSGLRPLVGLQSAQFVGTTAMTSYEVGCGGGRTITVYGTGGVGTTQLVSPLFLMVQFV